MSASATTIVRRAALGTPRPMPADDLRRCHAVGAAAPIVDVRPPEAFARGHIQGSINVPETQITALMQTLGRLGNAVLVCDEGAVAAAVCRTVGFCRVAQVFYVEGGLRAWEADGGVLYRTDEKGRERRVARLEDEPSTVVQVARSFNFRNLMLGLAGSVAVVTATLLYLLR